MVTRKGSSYKISGWE